MIISLFGVFTVTFIYILIIVMIFFHGFNTMIAIVGLFGIVCGVVMTLFGIHSMVSKEKQKTTD